MRPSSTRVAFRHLIAAKPGSPEDLLRIWLGEVGNFVAQMVGGSSRLEFKKGHIVVVDVRNPEMVERIGIRFEGYKMVLSLHHQLGADVGEVDSLDFPIFMKMPPREAATWAVENTHGRAQVALFKRG